MTRETYVSAEITSQPACWRTAIQVAASSPRGLPAPGERVAFAGCGTSWFVAMSAAVLRERSGLGETDAFVASEFPTDRTYDRVVVLSRSGTTTEVVDLLQRLGNTPTTLITAVEESPAGVKADDVISLAFADEKSVVQTRFATSTLALLRASWGEDLTRALADGELALQCDIADLLASSQCTFLGGGWAVGLAYEAALKCREAAQFWTEAYPAMDYRHGPIAIAEEHRLVWSLGGTPAGLRAQVERTGARFIDLELDPLASLVVAQRFATALALANGLDPDRPRSLTRSVILT